MGRWPRVGRLPLSDNGNRLNLEGEPMRPHEMFGVVLRGFGVWFLYRGIDFVAMTLLKTTEGSISSPYTLIEEKVLAAFYLALGMIVLGFASHIIHLIYPGER
jgi:hypothetical protein